MNLTLCWQPYHVTEGAFGRPLIYPLDDTVPDRTGHRKRMGECLEACGGPDPSDGIHDIEVDYSKAERQRKGMTYGHDGEGYDD